MACFVVADAIRGPNRLDPHRTEEGDAGGVPPEGLVVLLALVGDATLSWRHRLLASALLLGLLPLAWPLVALSGATAAGRAARDLTVGLLGSAANVAVLTVEPHRLPSRLLRPR